MKVLRYRYSIPARPEIGLNPSNSDWIDLANENLIVGRNASGKSRLVNILSSFASLVSGRALPTLGEREIEFLDDEGRRLHYRYVGSWNPNFVNEESLTRNGEPLLTRNATKASLLSEVTGKFIDIAPPPEQTVISVRRDKKEFPYFESLVEWAKGVYSYKFGNVHPYDSFESNRTFFSRGYNDVFNEALGSLAGSPNSIKEIIEEFNSLGYDIINIHVSKEGDENILNIKEHSFEHNLRQHQMSQGMFRSLALLIYYSFLIETKKATLVIIDDMGEGLDFERSSSLGKIIFQKFKNKKVQLVATTNDFFLMNCVDIENWNIVIKEESGRIKSLNYNNAKEKFDKFHFTGMNNFYLFSSDFLRL